jgi:hypothetical protein
MTQRRRPAPPQNRHIPISQHERYDHFRGMQRRAAQKRISPPISLCGCRIVDPEFDTHRCADEISDVMADAAVVAAAHLESLGTPGLFEAEMCRAMWRRGHHRLASECYRYFSGEAA